MPLYNTASTAEFEEKVINSDRPVLVDFWANWCPPCHAMAPVLEGVAQKVKVGDIVKVDTEASVDNNSLAVKYDIRSIPNMKLFKGGKVVEEFIGVTPSSVLIEALEKHA